MPGRMPTKPRRARWRPRKEKGRMNATETRFEKCVLERRRDAGDVIRWEYEAIRFRYGLDSKATYTPDFLVFRADGLIEVIDVKGSGGWEAATRVKFKACAEKYPEFIWVGQTEVRGARGSFDAETL